LQVGEAFTAEWKERRAATTYFAIRFTPHPHAFRRNISPTSFGVFITCPRGSIHDGLSVIRSWFIHPLLG